ncbi:MAG: YgfZ/GcvT domain-containing protein [Cyanobacteriota bacterium]
MSLLRLKGPDSLRFLHGQTSQSIESAHPGQWLSTCCITPTARLRALAEVLVCEDGAWLVIREGDAAGVRQALDRVLFPADAVELGPLRPGLLLQPLPTPPGTGAAQTWRRLRGAEGFWLGDRLLLPVEAMDAPGPITVQPAADLEPQAAALLALPRLDAESLERWRIQVGWPACPAELNEERNPFELGLADRVSLSKGCYVGQETLARLATYDGVSRQLRRWFVTGSEGPEVGAALRLQGERAGRVTSALALPEGDGWIGLALVRRAALEASILEVERSEADPLSLCLSLPEGFVPPPVGAGGAGR